MKIFGSVVFLLLISGYFLLAPAEEIHWLDEAVLHDGRTVDVRRVAAFTYKRNGAIAAVLANTPLYGFEVTHPETGWLIKWEGVSGFNPVLVDFVDGIPYLVTLESDVIADLKQYGCPELPYIFFRYDKSKEDWEHISGAIFPAVLNHANLIEDFYGGVNIDEGMRLTQAQVAHSNFDAERAGGYFTNTIPKDYNSWTYIRKNEFNKDHYHDGCRPSQRAIPTPPKAQKVNLVIDETNIFEPELIFENSNEPTSPWLPLVWNKERYAICGTLLRPEIPQTLGWNYFINDTSGQKMMYSKGNLICDRDAVWDFDYVAERGRVVVAKYTPTGDLAYRISFAKPDEPDWYQGSLMQPTLKAENGFLFFEWWNLKNAGRDVHVKRSMKVKIKEPASVN